MRELISQYFSSTWYSWWLIWPSKKKKRDHLGNMMNSYELRWIRMKMGRQLSPAPSLQPLRWRPWPWRPGWPHGSPQPLLCRGKGGWNDFCQNGTDWKMIARCNVEINWNSVKGFNYRQSCGKLGTLQKWAKCFPFETLGVIPKRWKRL